MRGVLQLDGSNREENVKVVEKDLKDALEGMVSERGLRQQQQQGERDDCCVGNIGPSWSIHPPHPPVHGRGGVAGGGPVR